MQQQADALRTEALELIASAHDVASLEAARLKYLGKSGAITALSEGMRNVPKEERPVIGKLLNDLRAAVTNALEASQKRLLEAADLAAFASLDLTLPGTFPSPGTLHPLTQLMDGRAPTLFRHDSPDGYNHDESTMLVNMWIPLQQITQPLVLADGRSIDRRKHQLRYGLATDSFLDRDDDLAVNDIWTFMYDPDQQWYFRSEMDFRSAYVFDTLSTPHGAAVLPGFLLVAPGWFGSPILSI